jgi:hypothetical protein
VGACTIAAIVTHYQGTQSDAQLVSHVREIGNQGIEMEVHVLHDGPLQRPVPPLPCPAYVHVTAERKNAYGHNLRNIGMLWAKAPYIWHTNADNSIAPMAMSRVAECIERTGAKMVVFAIKAAKLGGKALPGFVAAPDGAKVQANSIDCMQAVCHKTLWKQHGGWTDMSSGADGTYYSQFAEGGFEIIRDVLGEHR